MNTIKITTDAQGIATLLLNRPEKHNAMSAEMIAELHQAAEQLGGDPDVRAVILAAEGRSFCAGGDLKWMQAQMEADKDTRFEEASKLAHMLLSLDRMPKPLIGAVEGNAFGGGLGLISVCDAVFANNTIKFGLTETRLGLIPATIGPYVVARIGAAKARRIFMSARSFDADEAHELGFVSQVCRDGDALDAARAEAERYLTVAPGAVGDAKGLIFQLSSAVDAEMIDRTIAALVERWETDEARAGIAAFFAKTPPPWAPRPK